MIPMLLYFFMTGAFARPVMYLAEDGLCSPETSISKFRAAQLTIFPVFKVGSDFVNMVLLLFLTLISTICRV